MTTKVSPAEIELQFSMQCWGSKSKSKSESERIRMFWRIRIRLNRMDSNPELKGSECNFYIVKHVQRVKFNTDFINTCLKTVENSSLVH